jgi:hypothetical protein
MKKMLLQMTSGFLQLESTVGTNVHIILFGANQCNALLKSETNYSQ